MPDRAGGYPNHNTGLSRTQLVLCAGKDVLCAGKDVLCAGKDALRRAEQGVFRRMEGCCTVKAGGMSS